MTAILTEKELVKELTRLVHWESFALQLPRIENSHIQIIKRDHPYVDDQKLALFGKWLRLTPEASWKHVIDALEVVDENAIAEDIRRSKVYTNPPRTHSPRTTSQYPKFGNITDADSHYPSLDTASQPIIPETTSEPLIPETTSEPRISETTSEPHIPETTSELLIPETTSEPHIPETTSEPHIPETASHLSSEPETVNAGHQTSNPPNPDPMNGSLEEPDSGSFHSEKELSNWLKKKKQAKRLTRKVALQVSDLPRLLEATVILQEQWKELGEALGMSRSELDTVSSRVDSELQTKLRYLYEVLQYWVLEVGGTLNGLVGALRSISQHQLANEVERRHADSTSSPKFYIISREENPLKDPEQGLSSLCAAVFQPSDVQIDWKVLGLMLGLSYYELKGINCKCLKERQEAMLKLWIHSGRAYLSVLIDVIGGPVIKEKEFAQRLLQELKITSHPKTEDYFEVSEMDLKSKKQDILNAIGTVGAKQKAQGIVFFIGVSNAAGVAIDSDKVSKAFRESNFVFYPQTNTSCKELSCLVRAVAETRCKLSLNCKYVVFYYSGHGGCDDKGQAFLQLTEGENGRFYIERDMLAYLERHQIDKKKKCLFFFDCCFAGKSPDHFYPSIPIRSLVAFATCFSQKSWSAYSGGAIWTSHLCENLKKQQSISSILDLTYDDVRSTVSKLPEEKVDIKCIGYPVYISAAGTVFLNGVPPLSKSSLNTTEYIWEHIKEVLKYNSSTLLMLVTGGLHSHKFIDDSIKNRVRASRHCPEGASILIDALKKKLQSNPEVYHEVLNVLDKYDQLSGFVRRMRKEKRPENDKVKKNLEILHGEVVGFSGDEKLTLAGALVANDLVDSGTVNDMMKDPSGVDQLLNCIEQRLDEDPSLLPVILSEIEKLGIDISLKAKATSIENDGDAGFSYCLLSPVDSMSEEEEDDKTNAELQNNQASSIHQIQQEKRQLEEEKLQLQSSLNSTQQEKRQLEEKNLQLHSNLNSIQQDKRQLEEEKLQLHSNLNSTQQEKRQLEEEDLQLHSSLNSTQQEKRQLEEEKLQLQSNLNSTQQEKRQLEEEKLQLHSNLNSTQQEKRQLEEEKLQLHSNLNSIQQERRQLEEENLQLQSSLSSIQQEKRQLEEEKLQLHSNLNSIQQEKRQHSSCCCACVIS